MDFNLKQWRYHQQQQQESEHQEQQASDDSSTALPLFVPDQLTNKLSDMSALNPVDSTSTSTRFSKMGMSYFSMGQWQELELQALIFRHFLAGACVPPELVHLVKKSLLSPPSSYYHHPLQQFYSHYHPTLIQSGYWGRGSMDPEPGRCRRTDGKKWRCSRDVVAGQKYCERHVHRGRNRSRKPVEIPTPSTTTATGVGVGASDGSSSRGGGGVLKTNTAFTVRTLAGGAHFDLSGPSPSIDLHQINQRPSESRTHNRDPFQAQNKGQKPGNGGVLRHFFDDWPPKSLQEPGTALSISTPGNSTSDFSLKLSTGNGDGLSREDGNNLDRDGVQLNWGGGWGTNQAATMGGPLAEVLRSSSTYNSSPTSVLHRLQRGSTSETSYVST